MPLGEPYNPHRPLRGGLLHKRAGPLRPDARCPMITGIMEFESKLSNSGKNQMIAKPLRKAATVRPMPLISILLRLERNRNETLSLLFPHFPTAAIYSPPHRSGDFAMRRSAAQAMAPGYSPYKSVIFGDMCGKYHSLQSFPSLGAREAGERERL